jgi:hypothetical protein
MPDYALKKHENGTIYVHWTEARRSKRRSTGTTDMAEAKRFLGTFLLMDLSADMGQTADAKLVFSDAWSVFETHHFIKKSVSAPRNVCVGRYLNTVFGDLAVAAIRQSHVDKYMRDRAAGRIGTPAALGTIGLEIRKMIAACNYAARRKKLMPVADLPEIEQP